MFKSGQRLTQRWTTRFALAWSAMWTVIGTAAALRGSSALGTAFLMTNAPAYVAMVGVGFTSSAVVALAPLPDAVSVWIIVLWPLVLLLSLATATYAQGLAMGAAVNWLTRRRFGPSSDRCKRRSVHESGAAAA